MSQADQNMLRSSDLARSRDLVRRGKKETELRAECQVHIIGHGSTSYTNAEVLRARCASGASR